MNSEWLKKGEREEEKGKRIFHFVLIFTILLGIFLRLKGFLMNPSFWHDELGIAWSIRFKNYSDFFKVLEYQQMAPPFFMAATKFLTKFFGFSEKVFRLIPFLAGCLSIIGFYFLSKKTLNTKFSILMAVFLFAINQRLITYCFEFKQYSTDVFFAIILLLFFINLKIECLSKTKILLCGLMLAFVPWFSYVSVFIMAGGFLTLLFRDFKKDLFKKAVLILPVLISGLVYLKIYMVDNYNTTGMVAYWNNYFIKLNPLSFVHLFIESLKYLFFSVKYVLVLLVLMICGAGIYYRQKVSFINIFVLSFLSLVLASVFRIYPFGERLILFIIPIYILLIVKPFDLISFNGIKNKIKSLILIALILITFYPQIASSTYFFKFKGLSRGECPREMMDLMVKQLKPVDIIYVNAFSDSAYSYYSSFHQIKNKVIQENTVYNDKKECVKNLNSLKKGYYWFYMPDNNWENPYIYCFLSWIETKKIIYNYRQNSSILIYAYVIAN